MREKPSAEAERILNERFGGDCLIALATAADCVPYVRTVNAHYEKGSFYVITYALSNKMKQIERNPVVAVSADWFTAHGTAENLGYIYREENSELSKRLETAFASWFYNGHNDYTDPNTCILCIHLTDAMLLSHGRRFDLDFTMQN